MKYLQIYTAIKKEIQTDLYIEGQKLPSLRKFSLMYDCSIDTIKQALKLLVDDQLIYVKNRSGYYVLQKKIVTTDDIKKEIIDFGSSKANCITFPFSDFQMCLKKAAENYKQEFFTYGQSQGLPELLQTMQSWLTSKQVYGKQENLFITTGVQQALFILSRLTFPNNKEEILVEMPTYHLMLDLMDLENMPFLTIDRNADGLDWALLDYYFREKSIKFFYTTPRLSSPLGLSYTEDEKKKLVALASKYDVYLVEDDYLGDYVTSTENQPLHFYDINDHVIYLKSFSKIMFPGLRIGVCLLPPILVTSFKKYRTLLEIDSAMFSQAALNIYIKSGLFNQHIKQTQLLQKSHNQFFYEEARRYDSLNLFNITNFQSSKAFLTLPDNVSVSLFEQSLERYHIKLDDFSRHFTTNTLPKKKLYGLELFNLTNAQIETGLSKIVQAYNEAIP